jgi:drug/metabolite transporter (DMT)-like permease
LSITLLDALLLLMALIWGANFSVIKHALLDIPPIGFNFLRLALASVVLLAVFPAFLPEGPGPAIRAISRREWIVLVLLALVGHAIYQLAFMLGLARTSVANTSLIFGCSPVMVAVFSAIGGQERIPPARWIGVSLSALGIYLAVGRGGRLDADSVAGDLWIAVAMLCWVIYTVAAAPLLKRHAPVTVTALSMALGTVFYAPFAASDLAGLRWAAVSAGSWAALAASSLLALVAAYLIWYTGVQRLGTTRTAVYSNVVPLVAMIVAAVWLGEPITRFKLAGTGAVLAGVALTKLEIGDSAPKRSET